MVNCLNYRFTSDTGNFKPKDSGDQRDASTLRDEVCQPHQFSFICACVLVMHKTKYALWVFYLGA